MRLPNTSLRFKLTVSLVLSGVIGVLPALGLLLDDVRDEREHAVEAVIFQAEVLSPTLHGVILMRDHGLGQPLLNSLGTNETVVEAHLFDSN